MGKKTASAHSAYAAATLQKTMGRIPGYAPSIKRMPSVHEASSRSLAAREAARSLLKDPLQNLNSLKIAASSKYGITFLKNSEILRLIPKTNSALRARLLKSPTRTLSGISPIALMPLPALCGGHCIYCPRGEGAPQSYTGYEPTTMRAIQNKFSARMQIISRLKQYAAQGHTTDKCHLIIMGGTFLYSGIKESYRHSFMKEAFETLNGKGAPSESAEQKSIQRKRFASASSLRAAIDANEFAPHRAIGVTFETRPDFGNEREANEMLSMGGTQVELGVQALSDRVYKLVRRGHTLSDVVHSTRVLKNSGFKLCYHMMPGLFSTPKQDVNYFRRLFSSQDFQPDMLKIYPALVLQGTPLYGMWKRGDFTPYDTETAAEVIADATRFIPPYVRIPRVQRDIPSPLISAGVKNSNLRQIADRILAERGEKCRCIRCREIGSAERKGERTPKLKLELQRLDYLASGGKEIFLSYEDKEKELLAGFLRLRIPKQSHRQEIDGVSSIVRELHVYGQEAAIGERDSAKQQHKGLGRKLLQAAEEITKKEYGLPKISVLSGPGARGYYRKFGYALEGPYMGKKI